MANTTTAKWGGATLTLADTAYADVVYLRMVDKFAKEGAPDRGICDDVCYLMAHIRSVKGTTDWQVLDDTATDEEFDASLRVLLVHGDLAAFRALVEKINNLKAPKAGALDKPDEALTPAEEADPN